MEWLAQLQGELVGLDSAPLIYLIEQNPTYLEMVRAFFQAMNRGEFRVVTSTLTLTEVLVYPLRAGNAQLARQYEEILFEQENLACIAVDAEIAQLAAQLRAANNLRTPDAIQVATVIHGGASFFLTNDRRLSALPNLEVLVLDELIN
ncbi:MAG: type II toxin-antitoxin system VapC family toxin [Cyanosarcina radialis HA8281-LM2]|jgi:predicted nucleic acid-binding protein|nr:type II toxin-antitoxin system VapC family toxin [Cyanosarcina radialis HA8281-LM2]